MRWAPLLAASATAVAAVRALQPGGSNGYARATAAAASPAIVKVVGVGGAGGNAVQGMISTTQGLAVEFIAMNTDQQALYRSSATTKLSLGQKCTGGLGAGGLPSVGEAAAIESSEGIARSPRIMLLACAICALCLLQ
jgi:cell division protein FtsZ